MISLMMYFVERDLDLEAREKFRAKLEYVPVDRHLKLVKTDTEEKPKIVTADPKKRWQAPPGWTPPGWNEEKSFNAAKGFMSFQASPGGKKK